ncbi:MAG TPA: hypothetical protein VGN32_13860 [Ktedonobacterales bacterium]|jgi:uncharacterized membrane protein|nr:hypothetical protein [Ktedonobacterales bacterium]
MAQARGAIVYQPTRANVWAIWSMLCVPVSLMFGPLFFLPSLAGILFGYMARGASRRDPTINHRRMTTICLRLNWFIMVCGLLALAVVGLVIF